MLDGLLSSLLYNLENIRNDNNPFLLPYVLVQGNLL